MPTSESPKSMNLISETYGSMKLRWYAHKSEKLSSWVHTKLRNLVVWYKEPEV